MPPDADSGRLGRGGAWLAHWEPEDDAFWETKGKAIAWNALSITTANLMMAFSVWFVVSAIVVKLNKVGYGFSTTQLFWLAAMPGLAAGTLRIFHTFLIPIFGSRKVVVKPSRGRPRLPGVETRGRRSTMPACSSTCRCQRTVFAWRPTTPVSCSVSSGAVASRSAATRRRRCGSASA